MATILPLAVTTFFDANGDPLAGGTVSFYIPNTLTPKDTWQDAGQTILNPNPITLNSAGEAIIYGSGTYRQVVRDALGNLIWDQITADAAQGAISWGGTSQGSANVQSISLSGFSQQDGQQVSFVAGFTNTAQLTLNGIPVLRDTELGSVPCAGGEVVQGNVVSVIYDVLRGAFHVRNPATSGTIGSLIVPTGTQSILGALRLDGGEYLRSDFLALWTYAQNSGNLAASEGTKTVGQYGPGDGASTFTVPKIEDFIRGLPAEGRTIGSSQEDEIKLHTHDVNDPGHNHTIPMASLQASSGIQGGASFSFAPGNTGTSPTNITLGQTGGSETRPKNVAYPYWVKA